MGKVRRRDFNRNLEKIPSCYAVEEVYASEKDSTYSFNLHPNYGFIWDKEQVKSEHVEEGSLPPT